MPALPPVNHVLRVRQLWRVGTDLEVFTHHYLEYSGGPPTPADCALIATDYQGFVSSNFLALIPATTTLEAATVEDLTSSSGAVGTGGTAIVGTSTGHPGPGSLATNVQSLILRRYRGGKPRCMWPIGTADDLTTPQTWKTTYLSSFITAHNSFATAVLAITAGTTAMVSFVNVSYFEGFMVVTNPVTGRARNVPKLRPGGPVTDLVPSFAVHSNVGQVRRRA